MQSDNSNVGGEGLRAVKTSRLGLGSARLDEYFGTWAIAPEHGRGLAQRAANMNLRVHIAQQEATYEAESRAETQAATRFGDGYGEMLLEDGTAVIRIEGTLMKFASSMSRGTGTVQLRRMVRKAHADAGVQRVMIVIDSPGGTVAGTKELADDIAALAAAKPTHAYVEDLMASAALWIGVQANSVSANETALVGSIGTFMAVYDYSKYAAKQGLKVHVITSDEASDYKGAGTPGTKITDKQLTEWRRVVNGLNSLFLAGVAQGRKKLGAAKVKELADGRVHIASESKALGLIDHVESFDAAMQRLRGVGGGTQRRDGARQDAGIEPNSDETPAASGGANEDDNAGGTAAGESDTTAAAGGDDPAGSEANTRKETEMSQASEAAKAKGSAPAPTEPKAATMSELKSACPGAPDSFLVEQAEAGATVAVAKDAFLGFQAAQIRARDEELAKLKSEGTPEKKEEQPAAKKSGVKPIEGKAAEQQQAAGDGNLTAQFHARRDQLVKERNITRAAAVMAIAKEDPELHQAFIDAANAR